MNFIWLNCYSLAIIASDVKNIEMKKVLITGGSKGIGRSIVFEFASHGFEVVTCSRSVENLDVLEKEFLHAFPDGRLTTIMADLSNKKGRAVFCEAILGLSIDVLVNNAGVFIPGTIHKEEEGLLELMIETNLYSAYDVTRAVVPKMKEQKSGMIFNICSTASIMAYENGGSYSISKFALLGFGKTLRQELKEDQIKVTNVLPGPTFTASWEGVEVPQERFMKPEDVAKTIWDVYSLSDRTVVEEILLRPQLGDL